VKRRLEGLIVREERGEILVLDEAEGRIHQLNETAAFIWRRCDASVCPEDIAVSLAQTYDVDLEQAMADVRTAIAALGELSLLAE
jgi:hypothetical protein